LLRHRSAPPIKSFCSDFEFTGLLASGIATEQDLGDDDTEGYSFEAAPEALPSGLALSVPALDWGSASLLDPPLSSCQSSPSLSCIPTATAPAPMATRALRPLEPARLFNRKKGSKGRKKKHAERSGRAALHSNQVNARRRAVEKHVLPSLPIQTDLQAQKLGHTKAGFTGPRDKRCSELYSLAELVGDELGLGFQLKAWDGRCALRLHLPTSC
jgi:hypothetical protein